MKDTDVAYIAGLFDGEGSIDFKRRYENRKGRKGKRYLTNAMNITMRIEMTHESILRWIKEKIRKFKADRAFRKKLKEIKKRDPFTYKNF